MTVASPGLSSEHPGPSGQSGPHRAILPLPGLLGISSSYTTDISLEFNAVRVTSSAFSPGISSWPLNGTVQTRSVPESAAFSACSREPTRAEGRLKSRADFQLRGWSVPPTCASFEGHPHCTRLPAPQTHSAFLLL